MRKYFGTPSGVHVVVIGLLIGCNIGGDDDCLGLCGDEPATSTSTHGASAAEGSSSGTSTGGSSGTEGGSSSGSSEFIFDVGSLDLPSHDIDCDGEECTCVLDHSPCDADSDDPFAAMGINCPGEPQFTTSTLGPTGPYDYFGVGEVPTGAIGVRSSFGGTDKFSPREGESYAVIGTGFLASLDLEPPPSGFEYLHDCNDDLGDEFDPPSVPDPIAYESVDCVADPSAVGTGDCSGTLEDQFTQGVGWYDWTELQIGGFVPEDASSFSFDFAFFTYEYPEYFETQFNDMFVGWLESENWTGNISFDEQGHPISLNASFLDYKDDDASALEFEGTCMQGHAGTDWLTTSVGVIPGEYVSISFAVFDLSDSALDSYVFIDNVSWGCDEIAGPVTEPAG